jgi:hypothetical protein
MLKRPVGKIVIAPTYSGFTEEMVSVRISFVDECSNKSRINILGLVKSRGEF